MKHILSLSFATIFMFSNNVSAQGNSYNSHKPVPPNTATENRNKANQKAIIPPTYNGVKNQQGRQANSNTQFARGKRAPWQYRQPQYYVNDWQTRKLSTPPRGYRWVRNDDNQFLLIAIASGIISQVFINENNNNYRVWGYGEYLPRKYRNNQFYIDDWANRGLNRPPIGRRWAHVHQQYLLININGGQISAVISAN